MVSLIIPGYIFRYFKLRRILWTDITLKCPITMEFFLNDTEFCEFTKSELWSI